MSYLMKMLSMTVDLCAWLLKHLKWQMHLLISYGVDANIDISF